MKRQKFTRMTAEFPFLKTIIADQNLSADSIGSIRVKRGDRNLLGITPHAWAHDTGEHGSHEGSRYFWCVISGDVRQLKSSWDRTMIPHGSRATETATPIRSQLLSINQEVLYVVEIYREHWDHEEIISDIVVYKMDHLNFRFDPHMETRDTDGDMCVDGPDPTPWDGSVD